MANAKDWAVSTTTFSMERHWGIRVEWFGFEYLLAVTVNSAPAIRIVIFGVSLYAGRLLEPPKSVRLDMREIAASKGWIHQGGAQ